ncbi:uncharacterized protein [Solanum lycopersicum]|uniref:uncharacterized protein n=1 Tax=Solanum lycopersicum TaxID=4081 RepID=UPI000532F522|nr:uncharacterized protein LOC104645812 [Solanum lycopersicum]
MDFIVRLPRNSRGVDNICVIVDQLTKSTHFLPIHTTFSAKRLARIYIREYDSIKLDDRQSYIEDPVAFLDKDGRQLRPRAIHVVKIHWRNRLVEETIWETEQELREHFPDLFESSCTF